MEEKKKPAERDTDLTIWAIVFFILAVGGILVGLALISGRVYDRFGAAFIQFIDDNFVTTALPFWPPTELMFQIVGVVFLLDAVVLAILGFAIWTLQPWARLLALFVGFVSVGYGIGIVILWYFFRADTKAVFNGKA